MIIRKIDTWKILFLLILISSFLLHVVCEDDFEDDLDDDTSSGQNFRNNSTAIQLFSNLAFSQFSNFSSVFKDDINEQFGFCITDVDADWNEGFNFSKDTNFLANCAKTTKGDIMQRLCTAAEIKFYFNSFYKSGGEAKKASFLKPNKNCNLSSWVSGCESGWACSVGKNKKVDLKNSKDIPVRVQTCLPCCEGFFCPRGITCMIPCPLGSYCPSAKLNKTTGTCDPYGYQLPPGKPNHTCGGADIWADITSSSEVFCSAGSYCPSTIQKIPCSSGHFCRAGSTAQQKCFRLATCNPMSTNQNITAYGLLLFAGIGLLLVIIYNCSDQALATREKRKEQSREKAVQSVRDTA